MLVNLRELKPNPMRDFVVDPIDLDRVAMVKASIEADDFWGGVRCRQTNDGIEIAAGHTRIEAAIAAGITKFDLSVAPKGKIDDLQMLRLYAIENETQRGSEGTSALGTVASAIRFIADALLRNDMSGIPDISSKGFEVARGNLLSSKGIGVPLVETLLRGTISENIIKQQVILLKGSGDYARIIAEVIAANSDTIEKDATEAEEELEEAEDEERKAKDPAKRKQARDRKKAAQKKKDTTDKIKETKTAMEKATEDRTFDLQGVSKWIKTPDVLETFFEIVTSVGARAILSVDKQALIAQHIWELFQKERDEIEAQRKAGKKIRPITFSSLFLHTHLFPMIEREAQKQRNTRRDELEKARAANLKENVKRHVSNFTRGIRSAMGAIEHLIELERNHPGAVKMHLGSQFMVTMSKLESTIQRAREKGIFWYEHEEDTDEKPTRTLRRRT